MIQANELMTLLIGVGGLFFILMNRSSLRKVPSHRILLVSFLLSFMAWFLSVVEGLICPTFLNSMEHLCYALSSLLLAIWIWATFRNEGTRS